MQDEPERNRSLAAVALDLPEPLRGSVLRRLVAAAPADNALSEPIFAGLPADLPATTMEQVLAMARALDQGPRALALHEVALRQPAAPRLETLQEALRAARRAPDAGTRLRALATLAPSLPERLCRQAVAEAVAAAADLPADGSAEPLAGLAPHLPEAELERALAVAGAVRNWERRADLVAGLAPWLPARLLTAAVEAAGSARSTQERARTLAALAVHCPQPLREQTQEAALAVARRLRIDQGKAETLTAVALTLPVPQRAAVVDEVLAVLARRTGDAGGRLAELAPHLSPPQLETALRLARAIDRPAGRLVALLALARQVPPRRRGATLQGALAAARKLPAEDTVEALAGGILPALSAAARERVVGEALELARSITRPAGRSGALALLAPHLTAEQVQEAIDAVPAIDDSGPRSLALLALAPYLDEPPETEVLRQAVAEASRRHNFTDRVPIVTDLVPHLRGDLLEAALGVVATATGRRTDATADTDEAKARVVEALAPRLPESLLPASLELTRTIGYLEWRVRALDAIALFLTAPLLDAGLGAAREIGPGGHGSGQYGGMVHHRPEALAALAPSVAEPARGAVLQEALATARSVRTAIGRAETLARLLPHLPVELHPQVVVEVLDALAEPEHPDFPDTRARVVCLVAPHLPGSLQQPALEAALAIRQHDPAPPASALLALAPRLRGLLRERALGEAHEAMQRIDHQPTRAALLLQLAEHTRGAPRRQALREALAAARATDYRLPGAGRALPGLVPHLPPAERDELLDQALAGARWKGDDRLMVEVAKLLPVTGQPGALRAALAAAWSPRARSAWGQRFDLPPLEHLPGDALHGLWTSALHDLATGDRALLLQRLRDVAPLLAALGDGPAAAASREAVLAVTAWWP